MAIRTHQQACQTRADKWLTGEPGSLVNNNEFQRSQRGILSAMALAIDRGGGRCVAIHVARVLKGDGERGDANMVMSLMCKKIITEDGEDRGEIK